MARRSEGVRRVVLLLSVAAVLGWISWVGVQSNGFSEIKPTGWLIFIAGLIVAYFIPPVLCKVAYWVIEGFEKDKTA
jgi:hypothetical protein